MSPKERQVVIFLHIPRTAGTTLYRIIERQYPPEAVYSFGPDAHASIREFRGLSEARRAEILMLKGHMGFGLHECLPNPSVYFTLLREPIDRVISHYYFVLRTPVHYLYDPIVSGNLSLEAFLETGIPVMMNNGQTRLISGVWEELGFGECTENVLELAKKNLREHFVVVGLMERFDETLCLLQRTLGWQNDMFYTKQNVTRGRVKKKDLPTAALHTIAKYNQLDIQLYQYAQTLFEEQVRQQGPTFPIRVRAFQRQNRRAPTDTLRSEADIMLRGYEVRSRVPVIGGLIAWIRRNLTSHLRRPYLDPTLERQVAFNRRLARKIQDIAATQEEILRQLALLEERLPPGSISSAQDKEPGKDANGAEA